MRTSEVIAAVYAAYLALAAALPRWPWRNRFTVWAWTAAMAALLAAFVAWSRLPLVRVARDWAPAAYIFIAYYATGALFIAPSSGFEAWLCRCDARIVDIIDTVDPWGLTGASRRGRLPRAVRAVSEGCYAACFLMIPAGFAVLAAGGFRAMADRYWTMVLVAELGAFAPLPWLPARPPWALEPVAPAAGWMQRFGLAWVRRTSHCANTFPSGHTAGSLAVAFAVLPVMHLAGFGLLAIALLISFGCVSGRYHYAVDVVAGAALALSAWALVAAAHL